MGHEKRSELGKKARDYVLSEFAHQDTIDAWHDSLNDLIDNWKDRYQRWECNTL